MNTPRVTVFPAHHSGVAMEPDHAAITRNHAIGGSQRLAGEEHLGSFQAPALLVIGVNVLIPANWIFQPFFSRISEGGFNLRAHIGLADTPVELSHEDSRRYLLQQSTVFGLRVWLSCIRNGFWPISSEMGQNRSRIQGRLG